MKSSLCEREVREAEQAWMRLPLAEQSRWASRHAFMAIWLTENVLDPEPDLFEETE